MPRSPVRAGHRHVSPQQSPTAHCAYCGHRPGSRPPRRAPRTPKGKQRMKEVDPVSGIAQEWQNRNTPNPRSRFVRDNLTPQQLDKQTNDLINDLIPLRRQAVEATSPISSGGLDVDSMREELRIRDENRAMNDGEGVMRAFNLGSSLYPERFETLKNNIYSGLDNVVDNQMKFNPDLAYNDAVKLVGLSNLPASLYGTADPFRSGLADDFLAEWRSLRQRAAADRVGIIMDLPASSTPLGEPIQTVNDMLFPGV